MTGEVTHVPLAALGTRFQALRAERGYADDELTPLPIRVAQLPGGALEIVDGFKRAKAWQAAGIVTGVALVQPLSATAAKQALLAANAPRRTLSPLDEARVVHSLAEEDALRPKAIGRLLGRKPAWVHKRLALARLLDPALCAAIDRAPSASRWPTP